MNDTERDLRELFESKARDAGAAPPVTREVLRRGRRRQLGTVAVAGITALAVAAAAIVSLQALNRADTDAVPGGPHGNPAFTATIQNFTLTVPQGWTLIDMTVLAANIPVGSEEHFSCVGTPIEAGSGNADTPVAKDDCTSTEVQGTATGSIPRGGLPMLTLSNQDPGLGTVACNAGGSLPVTSATLYIGLDFGRTRVAGWESEYPVDRGPLTNVLEGDVPIDQMPCGPGGYSRFQAGGMPFTVWAGFGSEVDDADRQAIIDTFDGMQVTDAEITPPTTEMPGYVLTGGTTGSGAGWTVQAFPTGTNVEMAYTEEGGRWGGAGEFGPPLVPIQLASGHGVVFGSITFDADRVELRPSDGSDPIRGTILQLPESLGAPFDAFVVPSGAGGDVFAMGPDGDLGSATVEGETSTGPTLDDRRVQADLRNTYVAAKTFFVDAHSYEGFTPEEAAAIEPSLKYNTAAAAVSGEVSIRDAGSDRIVLAEMSGSGTTLCIAEQPDGLTTYGAVDAQTAAECVGGEAAWGKDSQPTATPPPFPPTSLPIDAYASGQSFGGVWIFRAFIDDAGEYCTQLEFTDAGGQQVGSGGCSSSLPPSDRPRVDQAGSKAGQFVLVWVPKDVARVSIDVDDGAPITTADFFSAPPFGAAARLTVIAMPTAHGSGTITFAQDNGSTSYPDRRIDW